MKKSKKSLKGMTLIEMIISIAIFAVMGGLLILVGTHIDATNRATNVLKSKISAESPVAANGRPDKSPVTLTPSNITVDVSINDMGDPASVSLEAQKYNTREIIEDGLGDADKIAIRNKANGGLNFQFVKYKTADPNADPNATPADPNADPNATPADPNATPADPNANPADSNSST